MATLPPSSGAHSTPFRISSSIANISSVAGMLPFKLVYHEGYDLRLGEHVFQSQKFRMVRDLLLAEHIAEPADILAPEPATDEDILRVHTRGCVDKLQHDTLSLTQPTRLEIPSSQPTATGL